MKFIHANQSAAQAALFDRLAKEIDSGKNVLWLVSGGSNIATTVVVMQLLTAKQSEQITIGLIDERYGPVGHPDSNWANIYKAGFNPKKAHLLPILQHGVSFSHTVEAYEFTLREAFRRSDIVIAQLGIGDDGHTAGILPNSPACDDTESLVVAYSSIPYERITLTFKALRHINVAFVLAYGESKKSQLEKLEHKIIALSKQPAQILKAIKEAYVYNG